jgi:outer membrane protein assembly factor BamB
VEYLDFELEIGQSSDGTYPVAVLRSPAGEVRSTFRLPFDGAELAQQLLAVDMALLRSGVVRRRTMSRDQGAVEAFGRALCDALLNADIRAVFDVSRIQAAQQGRGLRLKLRIHPPELTVLPWEFLYDQRQGEFIGLSRGTPVVRYLELAHMPEPLPVKLPLRVLAMVAAPADLERLDVAAERQRLDASLKHARESGAIEVTWVEGQTWRDLQRALRGGPWHVFHFIGHGAYDDDQQEGVIALADEAGATSQLPASLLGRILDDHHALRLAVLNSCESARGGSHDVFSSTAATLMKRGIPAVLAMQFEISDGAAIEFMAAFYEAIADGMPIDEAVSEARIALTLEHRGTLEWGVPVLHLRAPDGRVFELNASPERRTAEPRRRRGLTQLHLGRPQRGRHSAALAGGALVVLIIVAMLVWALAAGWPPVGKPPEQAASALWRFNAGARIGSSPSVVDGTVYFANQAGSVFAVDAVSGQQQWRVPTDALIFSSPSVTHDSVYVGSHDHHVYALDRADGSMRWQFPTGGPVQSSPAVADGVVYVGSDDSFVYALDAATGNQQWRAPTGGEVFSSPAVVGGTVYVGSFDGHLYAFDVRSGTQRWSRFLGDQVWSSPTVVDGLVFVGSNDGHLYAVEAVGGEIAWSFPTGGVVSSSPAVAELVVYFGSFDGNVYAVSAENGGERWRFPVGSEVFSSPAVTGGIVYTGSHANALFALDAQSGEQRWRYEASAIIGSSPAVADGTVYVGSDDGFLHAVALP